MATPAKKTTTAKAPAAKKPAAARKTPAKKTAPAVEAAEAVLDVVSEVEPTSRAPIAPIAILDLKGRYAYSVGRRKTSTATVRMFNGTDKSTVNNKPMNEYFQDNAGYLEAALLPLRVTGLEKEVFISVHVNGGGINSQAGAVSHAIAHAIAKSNEDFRKVLKQNGLLTRDSRMKERKKPGLKGARRGAQWAKR
jgi:small subunit ribosomal protein S9